MSLVIEGTVTGYGQQRSGQGQNGPWYDQPIIIQQFGQYGEPVSISFTKVDLINDALSKYPIGTTVRVSVNIGSKQGTNGGWFTNVRAYKIEAYQAPTQQHQQPAAPAAAPAPVAAAAPYPQAAAPQQQAQPQPVWNGAQWVYPNGALAQQPTAPAPAPAAPQPPAPAFQQPAAPTFQAPAPGAPIAANPAQQAFFNPDPSDIPF